MSKAKLHSFMRSEGRKGPGWTIESPLFPLARGTGRFANSFLRQTGYPSKCSAVYSASEYRSECFQCKQPQRERERKKERERERRREK